MTNQWMQLGAYLCFGLMVTGPIFLVVFRGRFWSAFFAAWFCMVAETHFSVYHGLDLLERGLVTSASDTTSIGLTLFSGWIPALLYCGVLVLVRKLLRYAGVLQPIKDKPDEDEQAASSVESSR